MLIKLCYWKISLLKINNLLLDDKPFYQACITLFSITISTTTVIEAKNKAPVTPSIIHKTQQLNILSSERKLVKLSYVVGGADRNNLSHEAFGAIIMNSAAPELFTFTNHAVKHKKTIMN